MSIRTRLTLLILAAVAIAITSGLASSRALHGMAAARSKARASYDDQRRADALKHAFLRGSSELTAVLAGDDDPATRRRCDELRARADALLGELLESATSNEEREIVRDLDGEIGRYHLAAQRALFLARKGDERVAYRRMRALVTEELYPAIGAKVEALHALKTAAVAAAEKEADKRGLFMSTFLAVGYVLLMGIGISSIFLVWSWLVRPVRILEHTTSRISGGEPAPSIPIRSKDELGRLARSIETMAGSIRRYQEELVEKERLAAVGEMTAAVAHNVRNPLASIRAVAQACARHTNGASPELGDSMKTVMKSVDRADRWLKDMLQQLRPVQVAKTIEDVNAVMRDIAGATAEHAARRDVGVRLELDETLPRVELDPRRMVQALYALVVNAIEASPAGEQVVLRTGRSGVAPSRVEITIEDHGPGMDADAAKKIFAAFASTKKSGLGLGLNLTQRIVIGHGGTIAAESEPGRGCRMRISLPFTRAEEGGHGPDPDSR